MTDEADWMPYSDIIPPDEMPHFGIRVATFIDSNGNLNTRWKYEGENVQALIAVGTMMSAAMEIFHGKIHENS